MRLLLTALLLFCNLPLIAQIDSFCNCNSPRGELLKIFAKILILLIITIILALTYFGFIIKGNLIPIVGEISLIVSVFACLCCWISISKKEVSFNVYRRTSEFPIYKITKNIVSKSTKIKRTLNTSIGRCGRGWFWVFWVLSYNANESILVTMQMNRF